MKKLFVLFLAITFFASCAGMNLNPAALKGNHARGNFANQTFLAAWNDYQFYAAKGDLLTADAKDLLRAKRTILAEMVNPLYGPIIRFNSLVAGGELIDDAVWNAMLEKLLMLDQGWYTKAEMYTGEETAQVFELTPQSVFKNPEQQTKENLDKVLNATAVEANLKQEIESQAIWEGILLELIRTGIHALRAMLAQKGLDEAALAVKWQESWAKIQTLDPVALIVIE